MDCCRLLRSDLVYSSLEFELARLQLQLPAGRIHPGYLEPLAQLGNEYGLAHRR